jgi:hexosaminidase
LEINPSLNGLGDEGYTLSVTDDCVHIQSSSCHGIFNALQTLFQLLPPAIESPVENAGVEWLIAGVRIKDRPRFSWRGFMLDEGRHFQGRETVLDLLDVMASLKMNVFHWHLTEDQGWRISIQKYPRLIEIGSKRAGTSQSLWDVMLNRHDGVPHAGHYTKDEIQEIVVYANERHITIVPEIEMPGHARAALAAYPETSCSGGPFAVPTRFGIFKDVYCPGKDATFSFLQNILDEMMEIFPAQLIHIGGDEVPKARWKKCPDCQRRIREQGLDDEHDLQTYFTNRIADYLTKHGKTIIGWNQALSGTLNPNAIIQYWAGNRKNVLNAVRNGRSTIISSYLDYYLDHSHNLTPLSRVYEFEPIFNELNPSAAENILGVEAPLWTEYVSNRARLDFQTFPRLLAVAETGWTTRENKDFKDFKRRLSDFERRMDYRGIQYGLGKDVQPPWLNRLFGLLTIFQAQRKTAERTSSR